jgi:hypothetical protein
MLNFLGENYYLDVSELERQVSMESSSVPVILESGSTEQQISVTRYDIFKSLIDVILTERDEIDENLGIHGAKNLTIPFKIAFNTLLINNILQKL